MKSTLFTISVFLFLSGSSQILLVNKSLIDTTKRQLYKSIDNHIAVLSHHHSKKLSLKATKAETSYFEKNVFIVRPFDRGADTLKVYVAGKLRYAWAFQIDTIPYPIVRVGGLLDTTLSVQQVLIAPFLSVMFPSTNWKHHWRVHNFSAIIRNGEEGSQETESHFAHFSELQIRIITALKPGDSIYFHQIYGGGPDARLSKFRPFTIHIR